MSKLLDRERINKRFAEIEQRLRFLKEVSTVPLETFLTDHRVAASAERDLEVAIQACLDIADHIISAFGFELPKKDRKETFGILALHGVIPSDLAPKLTAMAGQRNVLIHEYLEVEREKIFETIKSDLDDVVAFVTSVKNFLDKGQGAGQKSG